MQTVVEDANSSVTLFSDPATAVQRSPYSDEEDEEHCSCARGREEEEHSRAQGFEEEHHAAGRGRV